MIALDRWATSVVDKQTAALALNATAVCLQDARVAGRALQSMASTGDAALARAQATLQATRTTLGTWLAASLDADDVVVEMLCKQGFAMASAEVPLPGDVGRDLGALCEEVGRGEGVGAHAAWTAGVTASVQAAVQREGEAWCGTVGLAVMEVRWFGACVRVGRLLTA
jgi:hypothetical protein